MADLSDEALCLRLVRAFLSLPPEKRAEVIALAEHLVHGHAAHDDAQEASPT